MYRRKTTLGHSTDGLSMIPFKSKPWLFSYFVKLMSSDWTQVPDPLGAPSPFPFSEIIDFLQKIIKVGK